MTVVDFESSPIRGARAGRLIPLGLALVLLGCRFGSPLPEGDYEGSWTEADRSTVRLTLSLRPGGKAVMQRTVRWPDGRTEGDSWESEYRVDEHRVLIGSEGRVYAVFRRQGNSLVDPGHLIEGKPVRLDRKAANPP